MEKLIGEYSVVDIPDETVETEINYSKDKLVFWYDGGVLELELLGNYELIGISDEMESHLLWPIVDHFHNGAFRDYESKESFDPCNENQPMWLSAIESFQSLLTSKGLKGRYAILKTIK